MTIYTEDQESNAFVLAQELYKKNAFPQTMLCSDILVYATHHYAYCSPTCIILAKVVGDCGWFIYLAVGKGCLQRFFEVAPFELPAIGFARRNKETKWYPWERIKRLCTQQKLKIS